MFSGKVNTRRGGKVGETARRDRSAVLAEARREREMRKRAKTEKTAAERVQRVWRGYSGRQKLGMKMGAQWDEHSSDMERVQKLMERAGRVFKVPDGSLNRVMRECAASVRFGRGAVALKRAQNGLVLARKFGACSRSVAWVLRACMSLWARENVWAGAECVWGCEASAEEQGVFVCSSWECAAFVDVVCGRALEGGDVRDVSAALSGLVARSLVHLDSRPHTDALNAIVGGAFASVGLSEEGAECVASILGGAEGVDRWRRVCETVERLSKSAEGMEEEDDKDEFRMAYASSTEMERLQRERKSSQYVIGGCARITNLDIICRAPLILGSLVHLRAKLIGRDEAVYCRTLRSLLPMLPLGAWDEKIVPDIDDGAGGGDMATAAALRFDDEEEEEEDFEGRASSKRSEFLEGRASSKRSDVFKSSFPVVRVGVLARSRPCPPLIRSSVRMLLEPEHVAPLCEAALEEGSVRAALGFLDEATALAAEARASGGGEDAEDGVWLGRVGQKIGGVTVGEVAFSKLPSQQIQRRRARAAAAGRKSLAATVGGGGGTSLVQALATARGLLGKLWIALRDDVAVQRFAEGATLASARDGESAAAAALFCAAYAHFLRTADDGDVFEVETPLKIVDVRDVIRWLRQLLWRLAWADEQVLAEPLHHRPPRAVRLLSSAAQLFNQLYERHQRRPGVLANDEDWVWSGISASEIGADVLRGLAGSLDAAASAASAAAVAALQHNLERDSRGDYDDDDESRSRSSTSSSDDEDDANEGRAGLRGQMLASPPLASSAAVAAAAVARAAGGRGADEGLRTQRAKLVVAAIPQVIPFRVRVAVFHQLLAMDKEQKQAPPGGGIQLRIRRGPTFVADARREFDSLLARHGREALRDRLQVRFISEEGEEEAGVDGGGLFREFMDQCTKQAFDPDLGMLRYVHNGKLAPAPHASSDPDCNGHFHFLGCLLGKALYEQVLVEPQLALFFLKKMLGRPVLVDDLGSLDADLCRQLLQLKREDPADLESLDLRFDMTVQREIDGPLVTVELEPNGSETVVTSNNVNRYVALLAHQRLNVETSTQAQAFLEGFRSLVPLPWIRMFSAPELQKLLSGDDRAIDVQDWRNHTNYGGGYHERHPTILAFWNVLTDLCRNQPQDAAKLLRFVTAVSRPPLLGFATLTPNFAINRSEPADGRGLRLPSASTCFNILKLPDYGPDEETIRQKLLYVANSGARFDLS